MAHLDGNGIVQRLYPAKALADAADECGNKKLSGDKRSMMTYGQARSFCSQKLRCSSSVGPPRTCTPACRFLSQDFFLSQSTISTVDSSKFQNVHCLIQPQSCFLSNVHLCSGLLVIVFQVRLTSVSPWTSRVNHWRFVLAVCAISIKTSCLSERKDILVSISRKV